MQKTGLIVMLEIGLTVLVSFFPLRVVAQNQENQAYLQYLPDVPLWPGAREIEDQSVVFDKEEGRVVEAVVDIEKTSEKSALNYYAKALPALGWTSMRPGLFVRNGEQLVVKWEKVQGGAILRFSLLPNVAGKQEKNFQREGGDALDR